MKRHILFSLLAVLILCVSCSDPIESVLGIDIRVSNVTLTATTEQPMTKTTVVSGTMVYWEPGDAIAVFSADTSGKFTADLTAPAATAAFRGRLVGWKGNGTLWAVYPYSESASFDGESITTVLPATQTARAESFGKDMNLAIARTTDNDILQFYNVGGGVCFSVTEEGIKKVLFEGLNGEILAGKVKVGFDDNGLPVVREITEGSPIITLTPPEGQTFQKDTWYYLVALPGALEKGYKMRFYKSDEYAKRVSGNAVTVKRSIYGDIQNADEGLEYEPTSIPYPKTEQEWDESDEITMGITSSVNPLLDAYTPGSGQSVEYLVQAVSGMENVESVTASEDGSQLLIKQINGVHVNLILSIPDESEGEGTKSTSPAATQTPETKAMVPANAVKTAATSKRKATQNDKKALLLSPYQNNYPKIGPVIDTDYLDETLGGIGYDLLTIPPDKIKLEHFTGDYLSQYPLVLIASHGADRFTTMDGKIVSTVLNTGIEVGTLDDGVDRSLLSMAICNGKTTYFVTVPWLEATTTDPKAFSGSMVYFGSCRSYKDEDFANFFKSQNAGFLGHSKIMAVQFDNLVMHSLVTSLAMGMNFTHAVECISKDPWAEAEQTKLSSITHWLLDYTSSDPFPSSFSWKVSPSKLRKVDANLRLIDSKPINLKHPISGNRATLSWELPHSNGEFEYKVHMNGMVFDAHNSQEYKTDPLSPGTYTWSVEANLLFEGEVIESFRSKEDRFTVGGGSMVKPSAVDLGLSVKWADANIGASSTSDPGYYYAWGETTPNKSEYSWDTYGFGPYNGLTRYNGNDGLRILLPENDVVHQTCGGNWRMPTTDEWNELKSNCAWEEVKENDILLGYTVTSKTNDNSIFLPVSGYWEGAELKNPYTVRYWYGSLTDATWIWDRARNLNESTYDTYYHGNARCIGMPVRGVLDESANDISSSSIVDLGLSVKWAGYNVGANAAEELGDYYSWGNASPSDIYDWAHYPLRNAEGVITRYNELDVLTCLKREDDAAYQSFGGPYFRMPTMAEFDELINSCDWTPATLNGQRGYKIKSRENQNSIFLPIYGVMDGTQLRDGMRPRYWSSTKTDASWVWDKARNLNESKYDTYYHGDARYLGMPVRAVYDDSADQIQLGDSVFVDLGLTVDWARCNMGTTHPEEIGDYYAWGETSTKAQYSWDNYKFGKPDLLSKYNSLDGLRIMSKDDDIVYKRYGGEYRMPTQGEWEELWNNCDSELRRIDNRWGYLLTSQKNGNSIFLPLSGYIDGSQLKDGMKSRYWSSSLTDASWVYDRARNLNESKYDTYYHGNARCLGMPVRAIRAKYEEPVTEGAVIDLGLKVKWASCNIGATIPEDVGNYFAWGETATKESFTLDNYIHFSDATGSYSKYNSDDGRTYIDWNDDVVQAAKGENWRMPTYDDWVELQENCTWELTTMNGTRGYRIVSNLNSNSIFLPIAGYMEGTQLRDEMRPRYWSSTKTDAGWVWDKARNLNESKYDTYYHGDARWLGMPVRGVYDDSSNQMNLGTSDFVDMGLSVDWARCNMGSTLPQQIGNYYAWGETSTKASYSWDNYQFGKSDDLSKYNANDGVRVLYKDDDVVYKKYSGKYRIPTKSEWEELWNNCDSELRRINNHWGYLLTSKKNGNSIFIPLSGYMDGSQIRGCMQSRYWSSTLTDADWVYTKARNLNESKYDTYYHGDARCLGMPVRAIRAKYEKPVTEGEMIDLGLRVKWASCNFGADIPEDFGDYFAWGETTSKSSFSLNNYRHWVDGDPGSLTKYNSSDGRRYLDWNDDVVHSKKGGSWRMPTIDDWTELQEKCEWELTTLNGTRGYRIVSSINKNSIFIPIAGYKDGSQLKGGMKPRYWSSVLTDAGWVYDRARNLNESKYDTYYHGDARWLGMSVRGVYDDYADNLSEGKTVDMGLSVNWASCNIGSTTPEGFGSYFGWGETTTHVDYNWANYTHSTDGTSGHLSKYNSEDKYRKLDEQDDAAFKFSSGLLRMPTIEEWEELKNNATWVLKIRNGHLGYLITSSINGNRLFLPIAGYKDGQQFKDGMRPRYWASTLTDASWVWDRARNLNESKYDTYYHGDARCIGMPVRGVVESQNGPGVAVTGVTLDQTQLNLGLHGSAQLVATVKPSDATNQSVTWLSNRESVAKVSSDGFVTAVAEGTATITVTTVAGGFTATCAVNVSDTDIHVTGVTLDKSSMTLSVGCGGRLIEMVSPVDATNDTVTWLSSNPAAVRISSGGRVFAISPGTSTITATTVDGNYSASCQVMVNNNKPFESKDLGLSVQWATFNVGASDPAEYGEYFAWAETEPKDGYRWDNYKWGNGFTGNLTKYTGSSVDKISSEDDVAQVYWGDGWRMPTMAEQQELLDECDWTWTQEGLVSGYRVTSRKPGYTDQSIFLPASGYMEGDQLLSVLSGGRYWASTLFYTQTAQAYLINFSNSAKNWNVYNRSAGMTVRPVCKSASVTGVSLDQTELTLSEGTTGQLTATVSPFNAGNKNVTWVSSPESVATVSSEGLVTAVSAGTATITATTAEGSFTATCAVTVTPYESSDYSVDGIVHTIQTATAGNGINIVLMGDAFSDRLIADGTYETMMNKAANSFFSEEPYRSFKHLFNVYYVDVVSKNEIYTGETALGTSYGEGTRVNGDHNKVISYALNVLTPDQTNKAVIIVLMNRDYYAGTCYYYDDGADEGDYGLGTAIAYFPTNSDANTFTVLISHEAGGHGFGKLADEYVKGGLESTSVTQEKIDEANEVNSYGWYKNIDFTSDKTNVKWSQFIADERYKDDNIGTYEGGFTFGKGVWRPTKHSIMNDNTGGFNAPSRYAIWYRIHKQAYGSEWSGTYEDFVQYDKVNHTPTAMARKKQQIEQAAKHPLPPLLPPVLLSKD